MRSNIEEGLVVIALSLSLSLSLSLAGDSWRKGQAHRDSEELRVVEISLWCSLARKLSAK